MHTRRDAIGLLAAGAMIGLAPPALAAGGTRRFTILRGGDAIGSQTLTVLPMGKGFRVQVIVDIRVRIFGITAFRYKMENVEVWESGRLLSISSKTDDDGTAHFVEAERKGEELAIRGSLYSGPAPGDAATTTYWSPAFLKRPVWISTQGGEPLTVSVASVGSEMLRLGRAEVQAEGFRVSGGLDLDLWYAGGEWVSNRFTARGEHAEIRAETVGPTLTPFLPA